MKYGENVLRHELKYYLTTATYHILRQRLIHILSPDENMADEEGYLISSLYFDDMRRSAMYDKVSGTRFRKKFRIRAYDNSDKLIRLECKAKYDKFISKISAKLTRDEYDSILSGDYEFLRDRKETVCKELFGYHLSSMLSPAVIVEYRREAYVCRDGNVRITFDKNLSSSIAGVDIFDENTVMSKLLSDNMMIFEVKYDDYLPAHIRNIVTNSAMRYCAISKYVMCREKNERVLFR